jgi:hypothetical protein
LAGIVAAAVTTTQAPSATFQVGSTLACDGVMVHIAGTTGGPDGNLEVQLYDGVTVHRQVDIAASVLPVNGGWILVSWASFSLVTLTNYRLRLRRSTGAAVGTITAFVTSGTLWNKSFRGTTTGVPAGGERIFIAGEFTGGAGGTDIVARTVTMNHNSLTIDHGAIEIGKSGTLAFATGANTQLKASGAHNIWDGGTLTIGTSGTPVGTGFTANFYLDCATTDGETGIVVQNGGTLRAWGHQRWTTNLVKTKLTAAVTAGAGPKTLDVADATGWLSGDVVAIAGTKRDGVAAATSEAVAMTANAGASSLTVGTIVNYHAGVAPIQAEVINLTRNVVIRPTTTSAPTANPPTVAPNCCYLNAKAGSTVDLGYVEFQSIGAAFTGKRGIEIETTTGSFTMQRCALNGTGDFGIFILGAATNNITITECVGFNVASFAVPALSVPPTSGTNIAITNCTLLSRSLTINGELVALRDLGLTFTGNTLVGGYYGLRLDEAAEASGTFTNNTVHNCGNAGLIVINGRSMLQTGLKVYRCGSSTVGNGIFYGTGGTGALLGLVCNHTYESPEVFGCAENLHLGQGVGVFGLVINSGKFHGSGQQDGSDTAAPSLDGLFISGDIGRVGVELNLCEFGTAAANKSAHTQGDINFNGGYAQVLMRSSQLASPSPGVEVVGQPSMTRGSFLKLARNDNTAGSHRALYWNGTLTRNATVFNPNGGSPPSEQMTPNVNCSAINRLESGKRRIAVASGSTLAPRVFIMKDGSYNGAQPRLIVKKNIPMGITADTVLATMVGGINTFVQVGGVATAAVTDHGALEFCVDVDGTAGNVYVDDWSAS